MGRVCERPLTSLVPRSRGLRPLVPIPLSTSQRDDFYYFLYLFLYYFSLLLRPLVPIPLSTSWRDDFYYFLYLFLYYFLYYFFLLLRPLVPILLPLVPILLLLDTLAEKSQRIKAKSTCYAGYCHCCPPPPFSPSK